MSATTLTQPHCKAAQQYWVKMGTREGADMYHQRHHPHTIFDIEAISRTTGENVGDLWLGQNRSDSYWCARSYLASSRLRYIENINIDYEHRRQGVGTLLLKAALSAEHRYWTGPVTLRAIVPTNSVYHGFYVRYGFKQTGKMAVDGFGHEGEIWELSAAASEAIRLA